MKHDFVTQVCEDARKVLCVIVGVAKTTTDSTVLMKTDIKGEEKIETEGVSTSIRKSGSIYIHEYFVPANVIT